VLAVPHVCLSLGSTGSTKDPTPMYFCSWYLNHTCHPFTAVPLFEE
jgi:hypothetical protein